MIVEERRKASESFTASYCRRRRDKKATVGRKADYQNDRGRGKKIWSVSGVGENLGGQNGEKNSLGIGSGPTHTCARIRCRTSPQKAPTSGEKKKEEKRGSRGTGKTLKKPGPGGKAEIDKGENHVTGRFTTKRTVPLRQHNSLDSFG